MTWLNDDKGCGKCNNCGMDMDMEPFCVNNIVLDEAKKSLGRDFPWGLNINPARVICKGDMFEPRVDKV